MSKTAVPTGFLGAYMYGALQALTDPTLPADVLGSKQFATFVDVLGEGEIGGFPSADGYTEGTINYLNAALKDVYLNKTQIIKQSANVTSLQDNDYNFKNIGFDSRLGTSNQTYLDGISGVETENNVGVKVTYSSPVSRTLTNGIDAVRVTIGCPRLQKFEDDGTTSGVTTYVTIQITDANGTVTTPISDDAISGKSADAYFKDYLINFRSSTLVQPYTITVKRTAADSTDTKKHDEFSWTSYTEIHWQQNAYPNTAHVALRFDAENFPSIPSRMYKVRGIKVKIPSNATLQSDGSLTYSGSWNGSFSATKVSTSCPSWILYDLLINERYGLGSHISESQLDKFTFYSVSQYNNEQINNGLGGTEPRFAFNGSIQQQTSPYKLINDICSSMRCMPYWSVGTLTISQDKPKDSSYLFTLANVAEGGFTYTGSSIKTRATQINVSYFDNETQEIDWEEVSDTSMQAKYGIIQKNVKAVGCTSRGAARRLGKWILYTLYHEADVINFTTSIDAGVCVSPGDVIDVADPMRSGIRRGGRISAATTTTVTVDNEDQTDLDATNNATLSVVLADGSLETKTISGISGAVITVSSAFSSAPNANSVWVISNDTVETSQWRVVGIAEDGSNYAISALAYNATKFSYIEDGTPLATRTVSILNEIPNAPSNLAATEEIIEVNGQAKVKITFSWSGQRGVTQYRVQWRKGSGNFSQTTVTSTELEIFDTTEGIYEVRVFAYNAALKPSTNPAELSYTAVGKTALPADVTNLSWEPMSNNTGRLRWDQSTELDVKLAGKVEIRHSSKTDGTGIWSKSVSLIPAISGAASQAIVPNIPGEVFVKFVDDGGRQSANATSVLVVLPDTLNALAVLTQREDQLSPTPFSGAKTNVYYDPTNSAIALEGQTVDAQADWDAIVNFDNIGDIQGSGTYNFANQLDLGAVYSLDLKRHFLTDGFLPNDQFDSITDVDARGDWDGAVNNVDAKMYVRTTNDNPGSGSPTWNPWSEFANGVFKARGFEFKAVLSSSDTDENIRVTQLGYSAELQRHIEQSVTAVASGAGSKTITFNKPYFVGTSSLGGANAYLPSIGIQVNNLASGDYIDGPTVTGTNFTFTIRNSSGAAINKNFTWQSVGYGLGV